LINPGDTLRCAQEFRVPTVPRPNTTQVLIREAGSKLNRDELARLVRLYETILANTDDFIYIFDPQARFLYANARLLKVYAKSLDQVVGKTFSELGYPDWHADMHTREVEQIVRDKTPIRNEVFFTGDSGISGYYDYIFKPVLDANGDVEMIVGTTRDVTDASRAHAQANFLSHLTQQLSAVSDEVEINRIATAELGRFLGAQRALCLQILSGGQHFRVLPDWRAADHTPLAGDYPLNYLGDPELIAALGSGTVAIDDVRNDPRTLAAASNYLPLRIASFAFAPFIHEGRWVASIGVVCDQPRRWLDDQKILLENVAARVWPLIERARIEAALRASVAELRAAQQALHQANTQLGDRAAHLEAIVQQRTHKLSEIIGELEAFSYSISHDLRAPLRSMIGFSDILLEEYTPKFDEHGVDYLKRIGRAGRRMDRLIQDVLNFSRISSSEIILQPVRTDLLLRDVIRAYPNLNSENVAITLAPGLPPVLANEGLLTQCVSNLLENAVKFVPAGQQALITVWAESANGRTRLFFKDNGIGIPEHSLGRIFDIFQRVGRDTEGTGIGLAIVRRASEKMGGAVGVESEPGKGSLFWLDLTSVPEPDASSAAP
jgi:PAS domain S-box-containing protein